MLPAAGGEAVEDRDERVDIGAGIVQREGGPHTGFLTEATEDGLGAMMPGADGDAVGIKGGAYLFRLIAVENEREDAGLVGRRADEAQTGNVFEQPGCILQKIVFVLTDEVHADAGDVVDSGAETDGVGDIAGAGLEFHRGLLVGRMFESDVLDHIAPTLPGVGGIEEIFLAIEHADARGPKDLVAGEDIPIRIEVPHVYRHM